MNTLVPPSSVRLQSLAPLGMVLFMTAIAIIFFSSIEYYTERGEWSTVVNGFVMDAEGEFFFYDTAS